MRLNAYLRADLVLTDMAASDTRGTLRALAEHMERCGVVASADVASDALRAREEAHTTVMGHGMALPHATLEGLEQPVLTVALARDPVPFGPPDTEPVRVFFTLLSPPGREGEHIKLLARICRIVRHPGFMDELLAAKDAQQAVDVIRNIDEQHV
jgi:mannitol/fructose-specific phosphotransferase system IIA component (Ntr-type)